MFREDTNHGVKKIEKKSGTVITEVNCFSCFQKMFREDTNHCVKKIGTKVGTVVADALLKLFFKKILVNVS